MVDNRLKLAIAVIAYGGQVTSQQVPMWFTLGAAFVLNTNRMAFDHFAAWDINPVDRARNMALAMAMSRSADWLLMIDADTFAEGGDDDKVSAGAALQHMILDANLAGFTVVVAPVMSRAVYELGASGVPSPRDRIMAYRMNDAKLADAGVSAPKGAPYSGLTSIDLNEPRGLVSIDTAAAAIMAINLHKVGDAQFRFVEATETRQGLSEDHEFCRQIRAAGGKIACDTRVVTGHMGRAQPIYSRG